MKKDKYNVNLVVAIISVLITSIAFLSGFWEIDHYLKMDDVEFTQLLSTFVWMKASCFWPMIFCVIMLLALAVIFKNRITINENTVLSLYKKLFIEFKIALFICLCINFGYIYSIVKYFYSYDVGRFKHSPYLQIIISLILSYCIIGDFIKINENKKSIEGNLSLFKMTSIYYIYLKRNYIASFFRKIFKSHKNSQFIILSILMLILLLLIGRLFMSMFIFCFSDTEVQIWSTIALIILFPVSIYILTLQYETIKIRSLTTSILNGEKIDNKVHLILLNDIEDALCNIDKGMDKAINQAVKSERMKSELITNVSHDLKTPLTSIINYVDLLDNDSLSKEERKKYIGYLKNRSSRLKMLIEDLLEASKAASGNIELEKEKLEINALLRQTLGEYDDRIQTSKLEFIINIPSEKIYINGDGRRLFRVFQNLITNTLKYSLDNSRVYIDMYSENDDVIIVFKNISKYILNISEDELLEKFKRGDSSRSTEGNGLGLAITKSLVELHNGRFEIKVDGDLFKASVILKRF